MQEIDDNAKIAGFLSATAALIIHQVKMVLESNGYQVKEQGCGLDLTFSVTSGKVTANFFLHNLFLEIATIDRDEEPLRFDDKLLDFDYFVSKTAHLIESKLKLLLHLLETEDVEAALRKIQADSSGYERVRIWRRESGEEGEVPGQDQ